MFKISKVVHAPYYTRLGQNIFRHDGLLSMIRGTLIKMNEVDELNYRSIEMILTYDNGEKIGQAGDYAFLLNIIEEAYKKTTIWDETFGEKVFESVRKELIRNKKVLEYLDELRVVDSHAFAHLINVSIVVMSILKNGTDAEEKMIFRIGYISLIHDIGRLRMIEIFNKKGRLDNKEFEKLKTHPLESLKMLKKAGFDEREIGFIIETHEKFDGSGYPYKIKGKEIQIAGQLILISDVYNGLSSFRPHRDVYSPYEVMKIIKEETGTTFDEKIVEMFKESFQPYKKGMEVFLNDGRMAIIKNVKTNPLLPIVECIDEDGESEELIDLASEKEKRIVQINI